MRTYLNDPTGVRDAYVSEPAQRTLDGVNRYFSCVRYTAKKTGGQYAPEQGQPGAVPERAPGAYCRH